jgi:hypothetical protein
MVKVSQYVRLDAKIVCIITALLSVSVFVTDCFMHVILQMKVQNFYDGKTDSHEEQDL